MIQEFRKVQLPSGIAGQLFLHSMPGRRENWEEFETELEAKQIDVIACLNAFEEIEEKSPVYASVLKEGTLTVGWVGFPIPDFGTPEYPKAFSGFVGTLAKILSGGNTLLLHCAGGVGRTGMTGILLLRYLGMVTEDACQAIRNARSEPDTGKQYTLCSSEII